MAKLIILGIVVIGSLSVLVFYLLSLMTGKWRRVISENDEYEFVIDGSDLSFELRMFRIDKNGAGWKFIRRFENKAEFNEFMKEAIYDNLDQFADGIEPSEDDPSPQKPRRKPLRILEL